MSYETVRRWVNHFGPMIAADLRKRRLKPHTTWHLDEVYLKIDGRMVYLWRAVDAEGEVLDVLVQSKRNKHAALKLMRKLLKKYAFVPERLVTDDLRSYSAAVRDLGIERRHERGRWKNNRAENSHQPTRRRERKMQRFKSRGFSPEIPVNACRRLQHLQRPTPSHFSPNAPRASRCGDGHMADRSRSGLTIPDAPTLRARPRGDVTIPSRALFAFALVAAGRAADRVSSRISSRPGRHRCRPPAPPIGRCSRGPGRCRNRCASGTDGPWRRPGRR